MIHQLGDALEVPLRDRNDWLLAAGFAPTYQVRELDHPAMSQVLSAIRMMLANHDPFPAIALDRMWNIRLSNPAFDRLGTLLGDDIWTRIAGPEPNLVRMIFHPEGLHPYVANWEEIAPTLWLRVRREAEAVGGEELKALLDEVAPEQSTITLPEDATLVPVLPLILEKDGIRLSLFTVISTFGTAQDVTTEEMRIESFFPADEETGATLRALAGS